MSDIEGVRLRATIRSSMLDVCRFPGCATIVFGGGTCVDHDPQRLSLADALLDEAAGQAKATPGSGMDATSTDA